MAKLREKIIFYWRCFSLEGRAGLVLLTILCGIGIFAGGMSYFSHNMPGGEALQRPGKLHWLGTDDLGIDIWAQFCHGARMSLIVGMGTALLAGVGGSIIGMAAGYFGGILDRVVMRITDVVIVLPDLVVMILLGIFFGPSIAHIILVLTLFSWMAPARITRSKVMAMKKEGYIVAAQNYGAGFFYLVKEHFGPAILPLVGVSVIRLAGRAIVAEAGLSFIGLGDPMSKSWGLMLHHALHFKGIFFTEFWRWWVVTPIASISAMVLAIAVVARDCEKIVNTKL